MDARNTDTIKRLSRPTVKALIALVVAATSGAVIAADDYQRQLLLDPSAAQLVAEARGRIMIYEGLSNETVEQALDTQFARIQSMMFVNTHYFDPRGDEVTESDCD